MADSTCEPVLGAVQLCTRRARPILRRSAVKASALAGFARTANSRSITPWRSSNRPRSTRNSLNELVAKTIVSLEVQVAPRDPPSSLATFTAWPPVMATFIRSNRSEKKPTHDPSGDTNGARGSPLNRLADSSELNNRENNSVPSLPTYTQAQAVTRDSQIAVVAGDAECGRGRGRDREARNTWCRLTRHQPSANRQTDPGH
jgi:hypothetical protein